MALLTAELVYQHYLQKVHYNPEEYDEKRDKLVLRASNGGRCHRLQKYHLSPDHKPKLLTPEDMAVFRIGTVFHEELQNGFRWLINDKHKDNDDIQVDIETKIALEWHGLQIEGHLDVRIFEHQQKIIQIIDLKTMNPRAMSYFKKDPYSKTNNIIQVGTYCKATIDEFPDYKVMALLSGWDKDKGEFHEVELDVDRCIMMAGAYYKLLSETLQEDLENIVPVQHKRSPIENWECNYCSYNHLCKSPLIGKK